MWPDFEQKIALKMRAFIWLGLQKFELFCLVFFQISVSRYGI